MVAAGAEEGAETLPLTVEELASITAVSATTVRRRIDAARFALHGSISDSGIYYRRSQEKKRRERAAFARAGPPTAETRFPRRPH